LIGSLPIGVIRSIREDDHGLKVRARLADNWLVQPVRDAIRDGAITGMSFPVPVIDDSWARRGQDKVRTIKQVELYEVGPVVFPAYEQTTVGVRSRSALPHCKTPRCEQRSHASSPPAPTSRRSRRCRRPPADRGTRRRRHRPGFIQPLGAHHQDRPGTSTARPGLTPTGDLPMKYAETLRARVEALVAERDALRAEADTLVPDETRDAAACDARADEIIARAAALKTEISDAEARLAELDELAQRSTAAAKAPTFIRVPDAPTRRRRPQHGPDRAS
jgi:hypothetical protein